MRLRQRIAQAGHVADGQFKAQAAHQLEGLDRAAGLVLGAGQQLDGVGRRGQADDGHGARGQQGVQLQRRRRDDAKRTLGADQQLLEIIAGIVLAQALEAIPDLAIGQHRLDAQHLLAHHAVAQDGRAAGIGRDQPADGARAFRGHAHGEATADLGGLLVGLVQGDAGLQHHGVVDGVDIADRRQLLGREQDLAARDLAGDQAGIAALWGDRDALGRADADHGGDLGGRARGDQQRRLALPAAAPLDQLGRYHVRILTPAALAEHGLQAGDDISGDGLGHGPENTLLERSMSVSRASPLWN